MLVLLEAYNYVLVILSGKAMRSYLRTKEEWNTNPKSQVHKINAVIACDLGLLPWRAPECHHCRGVCECMVVSQRDGVLYYTVICLPNNQSYHFSKKIILTLLGVAMYLAKTTHIAYSLLVRNVQTT